MTNEEFKNMLYNRRYIAGGDYDNENPFVGMWLDDFVDITHEINSQLIEKACEWLHEELDKMEEVHYIHVHGFDTERRDEFLERFKKAMKGD